MARIAFVTGGTGFIGSHLVEQLLRDGWDEVRCLVRRDRKWLEGLPVTKVPGALEDLAALGDHVTAGEHGTSSDHVTAGGPAPQGGPASQHVAAEGAGSRRGLRTAAGPAPQRGAISPRGPAPSRAGPAPQRDATSPRDTDRLRNIRAQLSDVTHIFHFAAMTRARTEEEFTRVNVRAPVGLLRAAVEECSRLERVVLASSLAVIGEGAKGVAVEDDAQRPVSGYGRSKAAMEAAVGTPNDPSSLSGTLPIAVIRPPAVYGPREQDIFTYIQAAARRICPYPLDRSRLLSLAYVDDVVAGTILAAVHPAAAGRTYFLGSPAPVGWKDFIAALRIAIPGPMLELPVPRPVFRAISGVVEDVTRPLGIFPPFHREKAREMLDACAACSSRRAGRELGYAPEVDLAEGLTRSIRWYRDHRWL